MKFTIGNKVVPINKSVWGWRGGLEGSSIWKKAQIRGQNFLYVTGYDFEIEAYICNDILSNIGDYFAEEDLIRLS